MRRTLFGLLTLLGLARRGFFIPYRGAGDVPVAGSVPTYAELGALFAGRETVFAEMLAAVERLAPQLEALGKEPPPAPRWGQDWFPRLDAAVAYAMVHRHRPRRIVEVGSGHSTRFLARAAADAGLALRLTAIDPEPRATLAGLDIEFLRCPVQRAGDAPFSDLAAGDMLFVDSSHVLMPGTDVDFIVNRVLPKLPPGAFVHFHDIFLPGDYPAAWGWRGYNEQLGVALLVSSGAYAPEFSSAYVTAYRPEWLARGIVARLPLVPGALETSLWLRKSR